MPPKSGKKSSEAPKRRPSLRITRVYTGAGDAGKTRLVGGQEVAKCDPRIEAYGAVDELAVWLGHAREELRTAGESDATSRRDFKRLDAHLRYLQNLIFTVNGDLATRIEDRWPGMPLLTARNVQYLERLIDAYNADLPSLEDFILAGGGRLSLALQTCRVVCRRAERRTEALAQAEPVDRRPIVFLNRLSDFFFVAGRWAAVRTGSPETIWDRSLRAPRVT